MYFDVMEVACLVGEGRPVAPELRRRLLDWELDGQTGNARREQIRNLLLDASRVGPRADEGLSESPDAPSPPVNSRRHEARFPMR